MELIPPAPDARFHSAEVIEDGQAIAILLREQDGTISAIRIGVEQVAD